MPEIEEVLVSVWCQTLVDGADSIVIDDPDSKSPLEIAARFPLFAQLKQQQA
jgi:hypothetical protein